MSVAGKKLIKAATEAVAVAKGDRPAAALTVKGHRYVPASKPHKQTTSAVSSIAGKYVRMSGIKMAELAAEAADELEFGGRAPEFFRDIRKLAASCLAQDEKKGQGK